MPDGVCAVLSGRSVFAIGGGEADGLGEGTGITLHSITPAEELERLLLPFLLLQAVN